MRKLKAILVLITICLLLPTVPAFADDVYNALVKGDERLTEGDAQSALLYYELALNQPSADINAFTHVFDKCMSLGNYTAALKYARRATDKLPLSQGAYLLLCEAHLAMNNARDAFVALQYAQLCAADALPAELSALTADALYDLGDYAEAAELFTLAGALSRTEPYAYKYRNALMRVGDADAAVNAGLVVPGMRDEALRTAFETGMCLRLEKAETADYGDCPLFVPTSYLLENPEEVSKIQIHYYTDDGKRVCVGLMRDVYFTNQLSVIDVSPSGMRVLVSYNSNDILLYQDGVMTLVTATYLRGVEDVYRNFHWCASSSKLKDACLRGLVWSPDGRWAVLTGGSEPLNMDLFVDDLFVLDTYTGEVFMVSTSPSKWQRDSNAEPATAVLNASFNAAGDRLYYIEVIKGNELCWSLSECDMSTLQTRQLLLYTFDNLCENIENGADDTFICLPHLGQYGSELTHFTRDNGEWAIASSHYILLPDQYYQLRLFSSIKSGYGMIFCERTKQSGLLYDAAARSILIAFDATDAFKGIDEAVILPERQGAAYKWKLPEQAGTDTDAFEELTRSLTVRACALSADGQYALLLCETPDSSFMYGLLDMETMAFRVVDAPDDILNDEMLENKRGYQYFKRAIHWFDNDEIVIGAAKSTSVYRLKFDT